MLVIAPSSPSLVRTSMVLLTLLSNVFLLLLHKTKPINRKTIEMTG